MSSLPLIAGYHASAPLLWQRSGPVTAADFLRRVATLARALPERRYLINLCDERGQFLAAWCAALVRGQTNLLPASRAPQLVADVAASHEDHHVVDDMLVARILAEADAGPQFPGVPHIPAAHIVQIGFTSGTTGAPTAHTKRWGNLHYNTRYNAERMRECLSAAGCTAQPSIVATVPPQHMYGTETSMLLPLLERMAVHVGRPLFPSDVATALAGIPEPRVLVTTPVHLRTLLAATQAYPPLALVCSATAPMDAALAQQVAASLRAPLLEMFGSTETCVIATRRTASEREWRLYPGVSIEPHQDHTLVHAGWFDQSTRLQDVMALSADGGMVLTGRNADMIEIAGKRASIADLTRRLLAIPGVRDAVVFQPAESEAQAQGVARVQRLAAAVVAPDLKPEAILAALGRAVDPVFLPRPLLLLTELPRNALGKTARDELLKLLRHQPPV